MPQRELSLWAAYADEYGELSPARMYDAGPARVALAINRANGGKAELADFMPFLRRDDEPVDVEALLLHTFQNLNGDT